jgi:hypothetical protein
MAISSQNTNLNQFVPPMCVNSPVEGQTLLYNSTNRVWENRAIQAADLGSIKPADLLWEGAVFGPGDVVTISNDLTTFVSLDRSLLSGPGAATTLNDLTDVSIVSPILTNQALMYDDATQQWGAGTIDYNIIANTPTVFPPDAHTHTVSEITDLTTLYYDQTQVNDFLDDKIDVVIGPAGNFAALDGTGQLVDSTFSSASFATAVQGALADSALQVGDGVSQLINDVGYLININTLSITQLVDVDTTTAAPNVGQVLKWNGTNWVPADDVDTDTNLVTSVFGRLGDVVAAASDYDASQVDYSNATSGLTATNTQAAIDELDVKIDANTANIAINAGDISVLQNANYISDISAFSIGDLSDVDLTGVANNSILVWQANEFIAMTNTFLSQVDTPASYVGQTGKLVTVNTTETALEFIDVIDGGTY